MARPGWVAADALNAVAGRRRATRGRQPLKTLPPVGIDAFRASAESLLPTVALPALSDEAPPDDHCVGEGDVEVHDPLTPLCASMCPPRPHRFAVRQSHGRHTITTVPGCQG